MASFATERFFFLLSVRESAITSPGDKQGRRRMAVLTDSNKYTGGIFGVEERSAQPRGIGEGQHTEEKNVI